MWPLACLNAPVPAPPLLKQRTAAAAQSCSFSTDAGATRELIVRRQMPAARPRRAWRAAQHARSLLHQCRRRLPGAHLRLRIADRVYDRHRRRGAYLAAPGVVRLRRGTGPENPLRRAARSSTRCGFSIGRRSGEGGIPGSAARQLSDRRPPATPLGGLAGRRGSRWRGRQRVAGVEEGLEVGRGAPASLESVRSGPLVPVGSTDGSLSRAAMRPQAPRKRGARGDRLRREREPGACQRSRRGTPRATGGGG